MNKNIFIFFITILFLASCDVRKKDRNAINMPNTAKPQVIIKDSTTVQIIDTVYDFGKVTDGAMVEYNYRFKNTGTHPLIITNASASCGCTKPETPETPIAVGDTGFIKVKFNSAGRVGMAHKTINVYSNAQPGFPELLLKGEVLKKETN